MNLHRFVTLAALLAVLGAGSVRAQGEGPAAPGAGAAQPGTGFTYQGELRSGDSPVDATCDFQFSLWDSVSSGAQLGTTQAVTGVSVAEGRFTVVLNAGGQFGPSAFNGEARWLALAVQCPPDGGFTALSPRQALMPSPLALALPGLYTQQYITSTNLIGGHLGNAVAAGVYGATIGGGGSTSSPNLASGGIATVGGGGGNFATGTAATVGGGDINTASGDYATVGGGHDNTASATYATIGGGQENLASGGDATVGGGNGNTASGGIAAVGGGATNTASNTAATVGGGSGNTASGFAATVGGGNGSTASGSHATVPGGQSNAASGAFSFAAGRNARAIHDGAFVWADGNTGIISSTVAHQFRVQASGGISLSTTLDGNTGCSLSAGGGTWDCTSDRSAKANFAPVDGVAILNTLAGLPIETWNFNTQDASIRHIGPMAQDFYAAFGLGVGQTTISAVDADGVALAAIQGLYSLVQSQQAENDALQERVAALETTVETFRRNVSGEMAHRAVSTGTLQLATVLVVGLLAGAAIGAGAFALGRRATRH